MALLLKVLPWLVAGVVLAGCQIPQDPYDTLERVRGGTLRVGVSQHDPWVKLDSPEPGGVEPELLRRFAAGLDARIQWTEGSEAELIDALRERQLDVVVAGLHAKLEWKKEVAFTQRYYVDQAVIAVPPGMDVRFDLEGLDVQAEELTAMPGLVERKTDAHAERVAQLEPGRPAAAEEHLLDDLGLESTGVDLFKEKRVMATQLGENAFLVELEDFLLNNDDLVEELVAEEGRP
jgi:polar amino acid transport system substrate-binding protein